MVALPRLCAAGIAVLALAGCSTSPALQPLPSPTAERQVPAASPTPGLGPLAVLVQRAGPGEPYVVQLLRPDGRALPAVHAMARSPKTYFPPPASPCAAAGCTPDSANYQLPETSVSSTRVYFLDGEAAIKSLSPAGTVTAVRQLDAPANSNLSFAVSPDDRRLAVAQLTYGAAGAAPAFSLRLYVENLIDGKSRVDLFMSSTVAEWPVGWHAGKLVLAVGLPGVFTGFNPYAAVEYHLVDPETGDRQAMIGCSIGPLVAAGSACWTPGKLGRQDWTGATTQFRLDPAGSVGRVQESYLALSPDGSQVAAAVRAESATTNTAALFRDGSEALLEADAAPLGWLDTGHIVLLKASGLAVVDLASRSTTPVTGLSPLPGHSFPAFFGALPAGLG